MNKKGLIFLIFAGIFLICGGVFLNFNNSFAEVNDNIRLSREVYNGSYSSDYMDFYSVPTTYFTYKTNGGESEEHTIDKAFDRNFDTYYEGTKNYIEGDKNSVTSIEIEFKNEVTLSRFIFKVARGGSQNRPLGFPENINIYTKTGNAYNLVASCDNENSDTSLNNFDTANPLLYTFKNEITFKTLKFEFNKVKSYETTRSSVTLCELIFLQKETDDLNNCREELDNLFSNYSETSLKSNIDLEEIENLENKTKNLVCFEMFVEPKIIRAKEILSGFIVFDPQREMSTKEGALNQIKQLGDIKGYAAGTLKMVWLGTNRQVTGIYGEAGQEITIYVDCEEGETKLPRVLFSQFNGTYGEWWYKREFELKKGKNTFVVPSYAGNLNVIPGGTLYITNPYEKDEQGEVSLYFEGGITVPVFRKGGDVEKYLKNLDDFATYQKNFSDKINDITELVSDHFIMTVRSSVAREIYIEKNFSPQENLEYWDSYFEKVLKFDGVVFEKEDLVKYPKQKIDYNKNLNCNIRIMQPYGAAYAYMDHVGIQMDGWERGAIYSTNNGWGFTHELGHMMDIPERTMSECSNNMMSKYVETALELTAERGDFDKSLQALSNDEYKGSYFNTNRLNFLVWWLLESYKPGYWATLENMYRFDEVFPKNDENLTDEALKKHYATEKQVYYTSLIFETDMSYYFERWGFNYNEEEGKYVFKSTNTSETFKNLMKEAKDLGKFKEENSKKFWYLDSKEYLFRVEENCAIYQNDDEATIKSVVKTGLGREIIVESLKQNDKNHLGFEIVECSKNKVIGFTWDRAFLDTYSYNYTPIYKVRAYDRALNCTKFSTEKSENKSTNVCRIEDNYFSSIFEAVKAAKEGDKIILLKDIYESGIEIDKNIVVESESEVTLNRAGDEEIFVIRASGSLSIIGSENAKITLDGGGYKQKSSLIKFLGDLTLKNVILQNNIKIEDGGALLYGTEVGVNKNLVCENVSFKNNSARYGGAVFNNTGRLVCDFKNCEFVSNGAQNGGAIVNINGAIFHFKDCKFVGNRATQNGGALYLNCKTTFDGCEIVENVAQEEGGGVWFDADFGVRTVDFGYETFAKTTFSKNTSKIGSALSLKRGNANLYNVEVKPDNSGEYSVNIGNCYVVLNKKIENKDLICSIGKVFLGKTGKITFNNLSCSLNIFKEDILNDDIIVDSNFDLKDAENIQINSGVLEISQDKRKIIVKISQIEVTLDYGERSETVFVQEGSKFVLKDTEETNPKYVENWSKDGQIYNVFDEVEIKSPATFSANLQNKCVITLNLGNSTQKFYVRKNASFTLPKLEIEGKKLLNYVAGGKVYLIYTTIENVNSDMTFDCNFVNSLTLKLQKDGVFYKDLYVNFDDIIYLDKLDFNLPIDREVYSFTVDGKETTDTLLIKKNSTVNAKIGKKRIYLTYSGDNFSETSMYYYGDKVKLSPKLPDGYVVDYYEIDGKRVEKDELVTLTENLEIKVVMHKSPVKIILILGATLGVLALLFVTLLIVKHKNKRKPNKK